jgi:peptidoglycan/xylan/chitin deacetylase (PgdA/CDA1 family)
MNPTFIAIPATVLAGAAAGVGAVHPRSQLFGKTIRHTASPRKLALTFDDGPNPAITPKLLDLLDHHRARATFFMIGRFVRCCPELANEVQARGHVLANHTETHPKLIWLSPAGVREELAQCQDALQAVTGEPAKYFRPPYGLRNPWVVSTARSLGMQTVMWTLIPGDWRGKPVEWLVKRIQPITDHAQQGEHRSVGDVLCLHDGGHRALNVERTTTLAALEYWLPRWRDLGLEFVTIAEAGGEA